MMKKISQMRVDLLAWAPAFSLTLAAALVAVLALAWAGLGIGTGEPCFSTVGWIMLATMVVGWKAWRWAQHLSTASVPAAWVGFAGSALLFTAPRVT